MTERTSWDTPIRMIHWGLALTISAQLFTGLLVADPQTRIFFYFHEWDGLAASLLIALMWLWLYSIQSLSILFPWNRKGMSAVWSDTRALFRGRLPPGGHTTGLASFGHGLGLLAATGMAVSGVWIFLIIPGGHGASAASTHFREYMRISAVHRTLSYCLWVYWVGHIAFAILHEMRGTPLFGPMFLGSSGDSEALEGEDLPR